MECMASKVNAALCKLVKKIWEEGELPEQWKREVICSIHKKDDKDKLENYRRVTLTCTAYKIYASLLNKMLMKEIEDLNKAFDRKERQVLEKRLIEMKVNEKLRNRIMDIHK
ncbi:uncharacterized protein LOC106647043 [Copidosoma floridanum]|uniref:uncharacterized protein LOC106647043 n=1 Tax=Copidosoma floridanum TaxID=29053 RepID=UPI0006C9A7AB|nr:uncharacterized protein LOC106647043 [Copidosoma floridanum]